MPVADLHGSARKIWPVSYTTGAFATDADLLKDGGPTGIAVTVAGVINGKLLDDSDDHLLPVVAGINPYRFKSITESGTTATGLFLVRG